MKKIIAIFILIISTCALAACNSNVSTDKLLYCNWPENGKETFTYVVTAPSENGGAAEVVGKLVQTVESKDGGFLITVSQVMNNGDSVNGYVKFANLAGYLPTESLRTYTTSSGAGSVSTQKIVYSGGNATYFHADAAEIPDGTEGVSTAIASPYYDNMQFYTIIRGAAFNNKFNLSFNLYIPNEEKLAKIGCAMSGTENLNYFITEGGESKSVSCQLINISRSQKISGAPNKAYYATEEITVGEKKVKQALVKFIEGNFTYNLVSIAAE